MNIGDYLIIAALGLLALVASWAGKYIEKGCNCDNSNQGRECKNCTPPLLPRR